jgi:hypothetical protein
MDNDSKDAHVPEGGGEQIDAPPAWLRATLADLENFDFEAPVAKSKSAESRDLSGLFRKAADETEFPPAMRVFSILSAATGMAFSPNERNDPFGPMFVFEGRRSAIPSDFQGVPADVIAAAADRTSHPTLRSRLGDLCWVLDRRRGRLATAAVAAYVDVVKRVDGGTLEFHLNEQRGALSHDARDLLRRALQIGRTIGWEKPETVAAREMAIDLRARALKNGAPVPAFWFSELDLDFSISDPTALGQDIEDLINSLPTDADGHIVVELWQLATRAYHFAKRDEDKHRAQSAASDQLVAMAERQPMAMLASSLLSDAIAALHGLPGKKDRRKELRHRLIDIQSGISEEMSLFSHPFDLEDLVKDVERAMTLPNLRDKLFQFAALDQSPDPIELVATASKSIREHPLASLFGASHHEQEGKVVHRTQGAGLGDTVDDTAIQNQIAQDEGIRRQITASGLIEVARQVIVRDHFLSVDMLARMLVHSPFVPNDLVKTFSRGFLRFFQGDFVSGLYILTPLLENSLRHVLKVYGYDVTIFDDATQTQQDRTISSLFEQMRTELDAVLSVAITTDIENVFLKKPGPHLRHALSHGLLHDGHPYGHDAIYGCWLIFRLCMIPLFPFREQVRLPFDEPATEGLGANPFDAT